MRHTFHNLLFPQASLQEPMLDGYGMVQAGNQRLAQAITQSTTPRHNCSRRPLSLDQGRGLSPSIKAESIEWLNGIGCEDSGGRQQHAHQRFMTIHVAT